MNTQPPSFSTELRRLTSRLVDCSLVVCTLMHTGSSLQFAWSIACADAAELADTLHGSVRLGPSSGQQAPQLLAECDIALLHRMPEYLPARHWTLHMEPESGHCTSQTKPYMQDPQKGTEAFSSEGCAPDSLKNR